ncbi:MAG: Ig-like domain-containing protein, partial [Bacilli bacterium]|nr:Ig-like domain-containing protein [Bacilli bacterium]
WQGLFDKYGVDLVLTGHDHIYRRTTRIYQGIESKLPYRGTTYLIGGSAGAKYYDLVYEGTKGNYKYVELFAQEFARKSSVTLIQVDSNEMRLVTIGTAGEELDKVTLPAKRGSMAASGFEKESYLDSVTVTLDKKDPTKALFYWGNKWFGHVNAAQLIDTEDNTIGYDYLDTNHIGNFIEISNIELNKIYNYTLKVKFKDGTKAERPLTLSTKLPYGQIDNLYLDDSSKDDLTLNWFALLINDQVDKYWVYINDELYKEVASDATSVALSGLSPYRHNEITLKAADIYGDIVYTGTVEYGEELPITISYPQDEIELTVGASESPNIEIDPEKDITIIYASSDESVVTVSADGKITAVGVGEATVTAKVREREEATASIKVKVVAASEPKKEEPKKKGCFSSATLLVSLSYLGLILIIRRRRLI